MDKEYLAKAIKEIGKNDPKMKAVIKSVGPIEVKLEKDIFVKLARSIVGQQLSGASAKAIWERVAELQKPKKKLTPDDVLKSSMAKLRVCGLSDQKANYLKNLARYVRDKKPTQARFRKITSEEIISELVEIKGIGRWTVEMFLIFSLGRTDVLPVDDLGVKKGFMKVYGLRKMPDAKKMRSLAKNWAGHYTLGTLYLWRYLDVD